MLHSGYKSMLSLAYVLIKSYIIQQSFSLLRRMRYDDDDDSDDVINHRLALTFLQSIDSLWFRMRRWNRTCYLASLQFHVALPDDDEIQVRLW